MENYGLVSIITPSYNSAEFIAETIDSILSQTYTNWELLITDDCSKDHSCDLIQQYVEKDNRIKLFRLSQNSGAGIARNHSIEKAQGRFIAFCDSDDRWYADKLEKQLAFMVKNDYALSYTSYMTCDREGQSLGIVVCVNKINFSALKRDDGIGCLTAIYDITKVGKNYLPDIRKRQDWGLWLQILSKCNTAYGMKEPLAIYRIHNSSISKNKYSLIKYNIKIYRDVLGYSRIRAYLTFGMVFLPSYFLKKLRLYIINI